MKHHRTAIMIAALLTILTGQAQADEALAKAKNCTACHAAERKLIGPSFQQISAKYAEAPDSAEKLAKKVRGGGVGVWGRVPMPANPQVTDEEALVLVNWILGR